MQQLESLIGFTDRIPRRSPSRLLIACSGLSYNPLVEAIVATAIRMKTVTSLARMFAYACSTRHRPDERLACSSPHISWRSNDCQSGLAVLPLSIDHGLMEAQKITLKDVGVLPMYISVLQESVSFQKTSSPLSRYSGCYGEKVQY